MTDNAGIFVCRTRHLELAGGGGKVRCADVRGEGASLLGSSAPPKSVRPLSWEKGGVQKTFGRDLARERRKSGRNLAHKRRIIGHRFTGFNRILQDFTGFYRILQDFTGFYRIAIHFACVESWMAPGQGRPGLI